MIEQILNSLDVLKDDVKALREKYYKTAYEYLVAWSKSPDVANSELNLKRLEKAEELSMVCHHIPERISLYSTLCFP